MIQITRAWDISSIEGYARLPKNVGHTVKMYSCSGLQMTKMSYEEGRFIFNQSEKNGYIENTDNYGTDMICVFYLRDEKHY